MEGVIRRLRLIYLFDAVLSMHIRISSVFGSFGKLQTGDTHGVESISLFGDTSLF